MEKLKQVLFILSSLYVVGTILIIGYGSRKIAELENKEKNPYSIIIDRFNNVHVINNYTNEIILTEHLNNKTELTEAILIDNL